MIKFISFKETSRFHNPLAGGRVEDFAIEVRSDPLLGHRSLHAAGIADKRIFAFPPTDTAYLENLAATTEKNCYLCEDRWMIATPLYEESLIAGGRIQVNDAVLFPNLFPMAKYHAVIMAGSRHFLPLNAFRPQTVANAAMAGLAFVRRVHQSDPECRHFTLCANYLQPAGASSTHPHFQVLGSPFAWTRHQQVLEKSKAYFDASKSPYFEDLAAIEEQTQDRWIGRMGQSAWFAAYSPLGMNEINAVWCGRENFLQLSDDDAGDFGRGLCAVLSALAAMGHSTFNFSCFSGPLGQDTPWFRVFLRIVTRQNMMPDYRSDDSFFQKLLGNEMMAWTPEELAGIVRNHFRG